MIDKDGRDWMESVRADTTRQEEREKSQRGDFARALSLLLP
jgi:hypothetical protein